MTKIHPEAESIPVIAVWFSCGAPSAVAIRETIKRYGRTHKIRVLNNRVAEEDEDNRRFMKDVEKWLNVEIEDVFHPSHPEQSAVAIWEQRRFMSGHRGAPCTMLLKREARAIWMWGNKVDWHVFGFTLEEFRRHERFVLTEMDNVLPVLIRAGLTRDACFEEIQKAGIELPSVYKRGYPNANCIGCVKASSPTYWNHVRKDSPEVFAERAEQSRRIGAKLVRYKGDRIYLDELPPDAKGQSLKSMKMPECGILCEERPSIKREKPND